MLEGCLFADDTLRLYLAGAVDDAWAVLLEEGLASSAATRRRLAELRHLVRLLRLGALEERAERLQPLAARGDLGGVRARLLAQRRELHHLLVHELL